MITLVRVGRVLLILFLATLMLSLIAALGTADTGLVEKTVLVALIVGCVPLAAGITTLAERKQSQLRMLH